MANARGKALELVRLHTRLDRVQWELITVSSCEGRALSWTYGREGGQNTAGRRRNLSPVSLEEARHISPSTRRRVLEKLASVDSIALAGFGRHRERFESRRTMALETKCPQSAR